jgi:hypothetical protein
VVAVPRHPALTGLGEVKARGVHGVKGIHSLTVTSLAGNCAAKSKNSSTTELPCPWHTIAVAMKEVCAK